MLNLFLFGNPRLERNHQPIEFDTRKALAFGIGKRAMVCLKQAVAIFADIGADSEMNQSEIWKLAEW